MSSDLDEGDEIESETESAEEETSTTNQRKKRKKKKKATNNELKSNRHLSLAEIRGIIPVYRYYFEPPKVNGKRTRMSKAEKDLKWPLYKKQMIRDFKRKFKPNHRFQSEQKFIKRHTEPIVYLKHKLHRETNLDPSELNEEQLAYYNEIGGLEDVNEMLLLQTNIDSLDKAAKKMNKKRTIAEMYNEDDIDSINSSLSQRLRARNQRNTNRRNHSRSRVLREDSAASIVDLRNDDPLISSIHAVSLDSTLSTMPSKYENEEKDAALDQLLADRNLFQQEVLERRKKETFELFTQKMLAVEERTSLVLRSKPELIGTMAGMNSLEEQLDAAFDFWIKDNIEQIGSKVYTLVDFTTQITAERSKKEEWSLFLKKWKLQRIALGNEFQVTWDLLMDETDIEQVALGLQIGNSE